MRPIAVLGFSEKLGRTIRQDGHETLGISTQTLAEEALRAGRFDEAAALVRYFHQEMKTMHGIMVTWVRDIAEQLLEYERAGHGPLAGTLLSTFERANPGEAQLRAAEEAIRIRDTARAEALINAMRLEYKDVHDLVVAWAQDLLSYLAEQHGEQAVFDSIAETYARIWAPRYAAWDRMTPEERLQLSAETMRGGHLSGHRRRGDLEIEDQGDCYVLRFDPCGSGGVLRRGDPETGRGPHRANGANHEPHDWTWGRRDVSWYCAHCAITAEVIPLQETGRPRRPVDYDPDPNAPCVWSIYKEPARTAAHHCEQVGVAPPPEAP